LSAVAAVGFESLSLESSQDLSVRFIRGKAMAGKMRPGIHLNIDFSACFAGRGYAIRAL
jgi:hypothetical protein